MKPRSIVFGITVALIFFVLLPLVMVGINNMFSFPVLSSTLTKGIGMPLFVLGIFVFLNCSNLFVSLGKGTPVPIEPPSKLVIGKLYKITRNPIYFSYFFMFFSMALYSGHLLLYVYAILSVICIHAYVVYVEESGLRKRFGKDYQEYCKTTPRWL